MPLTNLLQNVFIVAKNLHSCWEFHLLMLPHFLVELTFECQQFEEWNIRNGELQLLFNLRNYMTIFRTNYHVEWITNANLLNIFTNISFLSSFVLWILVCFNFLGFAMQVVSEVYDSSFKNWYSFIIWRQRIQQLVVVVVVQQGNQWNCCI